MNRVLQLAAAVALALVMLCGTGPNAWAVDPAGPPPAPSYSGNANVNGRSVTVDGEQGGGGSTKPASDNTGPATRTLTCDLSAGVAPGCEGATTCLRPPLAAPTNVVLVEQQQPDGSWQQVGIDCEGDVGEAMEAIVVTAAMVRQHAVELLPPVEVGVAPADGPTLVNLETIFWSPTETERELGPVAILGQPVAITIRFDHATYDFGDGTSATVDHPGSPWSADVCDTAQCPTLDGHTYTRPADSVTATSTVTWTATFSVSGGPEQPIPGAIDGPTAQHALQVLEGRSILVR